MESRNGVKAVEEKPRGEVGQGKRGQQGGHAYLVMFGVMMVVDMVHLGVGGTLLFLGVVAVQEPLEISWSILELVLDRISDLPEQSVGLTSSPARQSSEGLQDALLG